MKSVDSPPEPFLSIVIPAYNEGARLPQTLEAIRAYTARQAWPVEVLVVDDGSRDNTAQVATDFAASWPALRVLSNPGNRGKGYSVRHGMCSATGCVVLFTDADLSAPIEEADRLLNALQQDYAVAIGSRALKPELISVHQSRFRENAGKIFNRLMRLILQLPFHDTQCGFKAFTREAAHKVFRHQTIDRFGFDAESLYLAHKFGYRIAEVPVRWSHAEGTKVSMFRDSLSMFTDLLRVRWMDLRGKYRGENEK